MRVVEHGAQRLRQPVGVHTAFHLSQTTVVEGVESVLAGIGVLGGIAAGQAFILQLLRGVHQVVVGQVGHLHGKVA